MTNFSKRRKVIDRVFSFLTNLGAERSKSQSAIDFQEYDFIFLDKFYQKTISFYSDVFVH